MEEEGVFSILSWEDTDLDHLAFAALLMLPVAVFAADNSRTFAIWAPLVLGLPEFEVWWLPLRGVPSRTLLVNGGHNKQLRLQPIRGPD